MNTNRKPPPLRSAPRRRASAASSSRSPRLQPICIRPSSSASRCSRYSVATRRASGERSAGAPRGPRRGRRGAALRPRRDPALHGARQRRLLPRPRPARRRAVARLGPLRRAHRDAPPPRPRPLRARVRRRDHGRRDDPAVFAWTPAGPREPWPSFLQLADLIGERGVSVLFAVGAALLADRPSPSAADRPARARSSRTARLRQRLSKAALYPPSAPPPSSRRSPSTAPSACPRSPARAPGLPPSAWA
jgi:hypothetical protein